MFIKFVNRKYLSSFINNGELFFGSNKLYQDIEKNDGNTTIGDKSEGIEKFPHKELQIVKVDGHKISASAMINYYCGYFCLTRVSYLHDLYNNDQKRKFIKDMRYNFQSGNKEIVVFLDFPRFIHKTLMGIKRCGYPFTFFGDITYSNKKKRAALNLVKYHQNIGNSAYWINMVKSTRFRSQREYRICVPIDTYHYLHKGFKLYLGDLSSHVKVFKNVKDFVKSVHIFNYNFQKKYVYSNIFHYGIEKNYLNYGSNVVDLSSNPIKIS